MTWCVLQEIPQQTTAGTLGIADDARDWMAGPI